MLELKLLCVRKERLFVRIRRDVSGNAFFLLKDISYVLIEFVVFGFFLFLLSEFRARLLLGHLVDVLGE